ncbi:helix-turn-helix domain-containing protein [Bradyrhizobium sp. USDA 3364]
MSAIIETWHRFDIRRIDDLGNAIWGADLEAIQMAGSRVGGSLAFAARDGIVFSSGSIEGNVAIRGSFSPTGITLGVVLRTGPESRLWLSELEEGDVGALQPGEECDIVCSGCVYVAATLTSKQLRKEASRQGVGLDSRLLSQSGLHSRPLKLSVLARLKKQVNCLFEPRPTGGNKLTIGNELLCVVLNHYATFPQIRRGQVHPGGAAEIVLTAREYIRRNLDRPISVDILSEVAGTSRRNLYRVFSEVLGDTPQRYVRRLRLHQIRRELISLSGTHTVSDAAHNWRMGSDLGRLSRNYRQLFGENPSATLALGRSLLRKDTWM